MKTLGNLISYLVSAAGTACCVQALLAHHDILFLDENPGRAMAETLPEKPTINGDPFEVR